VPRTILDQLLRRWNAVRDALSSILGGRSRGTVEVPREEVRVLAGEIQRGAEPSRMLARLAAWQSEPVRLPLLRLEQYARALAQRLCKGDLAVSVTAADLRLDPQRWSGLWSALIQVVRNAIDHGIEKAADRQARSKPATGRLELRARSEGENLIIEVADDGGGIDWTHVRTVATERGLPHESSGDLVQALFSPGFSTRSEVTATSGRGIGLSVVSEQVKELGGAISVISESGLGCCWRFSFPIEDEGARRAL
jgi:two-component system chemotaxis sensor kinase CheA